LFEGGFRAIGGNAEHRHHEGGKHQQRAPSDQALYRHNFISFVWSFAFRQSADPLDKTEPMGSEVIEQGACQLAEICIFLFLIVDW
jgi:hypothetical protein